MTAPVGRVVAGPTGRAVLDAAQWALACELAGVGVPDDFATVWAGGAGTDRERALAAMTASGMVGGDGALDPLLTWLFAHLGGAPLHVRVNAWAGDRVVLAHLAADLGTVVGLTRLQRVHRERPNAVRVEDAAAVEVTAFPAAELGERVQGVLSPVLARASSGGGDPDVELPWELVVGLLHLLRAGEGWPAGLAAQARRHAVVEAGLGELPPVLASLAPPLAGAVQVSATLLPADPSRRRWEGRWLVTSDGRVVGVAPARRPATEVVLGLPDVGREGLVGDVVRGLAEALDDLAALTFATAAGGVS